MADKYAVRNLRLCTKDCLCLMFALPALRIQKTASLIQTSVSVAAYVPVHVLQALSL